MNVNRTSVLPIQVPRTNRQHTARGITSMPAGKMVPVFAAGLHPMDAVRSGQLRLSFELMETVEILMNAVRVDVKAYIVPFLAFDRFQGSLDVLNRSFEGQPPLEGETPIPFYEQIAGPAYKASDILTYLGLHYRTGTMINTMYTEAYNQIWNFRAANRSKSLTPRLRLAQNLAPAFWNHEMFKHVVPDYDAAKVDGIVPLSVANGMLPIKGIGITGAPAGVAAQNNMREAGSTGTVNYPAGRDFQDSGIRLRVTGTGGTARPDVFAELQNNGLTISLANIELAKKTAAFARMREQYAGHSDEWLINLLMDGITIPDQHLKQPMLVAEASTIFGMSKRYATDAANLTESVVNGATFVDLNIRVPTLVTGGVLMIVAEITPEQLFERQKEPWLHLDNLEANRPKFVRDYLDPDKVAIVPNDQVDVNHVAPTTRFGYAPMNYQWNHTAPHIGGKFYRPEVNAPFDEDRQRFWAVETANPTLGPDFYLCTNIHTKPFAVTNQDVGECVVQGDLIINGNTQFGAGLIEASNDYQKVMDEVDLNRAKQP